MVVLSALVIGRSWIEALLGSRLHGKSLTLLQTILKPSLGYLMHVSEMNPKSYSAIILYFIKSAV